MGLNTTGKANTNDYVLGRGIVYLAEIDATTGLPKELRDLGNCPDFKINMTTEELKHQSSRQGLKVTDKRVVVSQEIGFSFSLDELNQQNYALYFTGSEASVTNPAVAGVGGSMDKQTLTTSVVQGRWYIMRDEDSLVRVSFATDTGIVIYNETTMMAVASTEYDFDLEAGMVFIHADAAGVSDGDSLTWYSSAQAGAPAKLQQMEALADSQKNFALIFNGRNPANDDELRQYEFHSVNISADGDHGLISDQFGVMQFKGVAQVNSALDGQPTLTITSLGAV